MSLKRNIGPWGLFFAGVSSVIGSGWLFAPFFTAQQAGPLSIISWVIGGIIILLIALSFAEISSLFPLPGGLVHLLFFSHGTCMSRLCSWLSWLSFVMIPAIETQATLQYSHYFFPGVMDSATNTLTPLGYGIAFALLILFYAANRFGIALVSKLNNVFAVWKIIIPILAAIIFICFSFHTSNFHIPQQPMSKHIESILLGVSTGGVVFSLIGFRSIVELAGESDNPKRNLPLAIITSILACTALYILLQVSFIGAIHPSDIAEGWKQIHFTGEHSPLLAISAAIGVIWLLGLLYLDAIISPAGTAMILTASNARIVYAMSQQAHLPKQLKDLNHNAVPTKALLFNLIVSFLFFFPFHGWQSMISFLVAMSVIAYGFGPICLIALRKQQSTLERKFKLPLAGILAPLTFFLSSLVIFWTGETHLYQLCVLLIIGLVALLFTRPKGLSLMGLLRRVGWLIVYVFGMAIIAHISQQLYPKVYAANWVSFTAILVLSLIVFYLAQITRLSIDDSNEHIKRLEV